MTRLSTIIIKTVALATKSLTPVTFHTIYDAVSLATRLPALVVGAKSPNIELLALIVSETSPTIKLLASVTKVESLTTRLLAPIAVVVSFAIKSMT